MLGRSAPEGGVAPQQTVRTPDAPGTDVLRVPREAFTALHASLPIVRACVGGHYAMLAALPRFDELRALLERGTGVAGRTATADPAFWDGAEQGIGVVADALDAVRRALSRDREGLETLDRIDQLLDGATELVVSRGRNLPDPETEPAMDPLRLVDQARMAGVRLSRACRQRASDHLDDMVDIMKGLSEALRSTEPLQPAMNEAGATDRAARADQKSEGAPGSGRDGAGRFWGAVQGKS